MKNVLVAILLALTVFGIAYAVYQPQNLGWVTLSISSATQSEIENSTAPTVGFQKYCTDCVASGGAGTVCVSTGAAKFGSFVLSTGTHCR